MGILLQFMRLSLLNKAILLSWGISHINIYHNLLRFDVFGSKYQGRILIIEEASLIKVIINTSEFRFSDVNELLSWLDQTID